MASTRTATHGLTAYDFKHPERITKDQVRTIRALHEKFAQTFGTTLSSLLRTMVQVELKVVDQLTYGEYMTSLPSPNCLYILGFERLKGNAILSVNPELALYIIDRLLGGPGEASGGPRAITLIEQSVMRKIIDRALSQLNETWKQIMPLEPRLLQFEMNPLFVQIAPATETVILISFRIFNTKMEGSLDFCLPYLVLEKILPEMSAQGWSLAARAENQVNTPLMSRKIRQVDLPVSVVIDMLNLSIEELTTLQTGDIIRLDRRVHDELDIKIDNQTKYRGRPGRVGSRLAVQITSVVTPEEEIIDAE